MTIIRPPYALEREAPRINGSGSISTLNVTDEEPMTIVKRPIGFSPPQPPAQTSEPPSKSKREIQ